MAASLCGEYTVKSWMSMRQRIAKQLNRHEPALLWRHREPPRACLCDPLMAALLRTDIQRPYRERREVEVCTREEIRPACKLINHGAPSASRTVLNGRATDRVGSSTTRGLVPRACVRAHIHRERLGRFSGHVVRSSCAPTRSLHRLGQHLA